MNGIEVRGEEGVGRAVVRQGYSCLLAIGCLCKGGRMVLFISKLKTQCVCGDTCRGTAPTRVGRRCWRRAHLVEVERG